MRRPGVCSAPVSSGVRQVEEIGAAYGDVVWRRSVPADLQTASGGPGRVEIVAAGRTTVTRRYHDGDSLSRCLLPKRIEELVPRRPEEKFAESIAFTHDWSEIVIDDVQSGQVLIPSEVSVV